MSHNGTPLLKTPSKGFTSHSETKSKSMERHSQTYMVQPLTTSLASPSARLSPSHSLQSHSSPVCIKGILLIEHLCTCCLYPGSSCPRYLKVLPHFPQVCRDHIITEMPYFTTPANTPNSLFLFFSIEQITAWHAPYLFVYFLCPVPYLPGRVQLIHCCVHRAYYIVGAQKMFVE